VLVLSLDGFYLTEELQLRLRLLLLFLLPARLELYRQVVCFLASILLFRIVLVRLNFTFLLLGRVVGLTFLPVRLAVLVLVVLRLLLAVLAFFKEVLLEFSAGCSKGLQKLRATL
jgi:hypothetical protein